VSINHFRMQNRVWFRRGRNNGEDGNMKARKKKIMNWSCITEEKQSVIKSRGETKESL